MDPLTGREVWIEELDDIQQYLTYLLDQFTHDQLLWLLSPDAIFKRHVQQGLPLRKNTLQHLTLSTDDNDNDEDDEDDETNANTKNNASGSNSPTPKSAPKVGRTQSIFMKPNLRFV